MSYVKYSDDKLIELGKENYDKLVLYCETLETKGFWEQARKVMKKSSTEMLDLYVQSVLMHLAVHCGHLLESQQMFLRTVTMTNPLEIPEKGKPKISAYKDSQKYFELPPVLLQLCGIYDKQCNKDMTEYFLDSLLNILLCMAYLNDGKDSRVNDFIRKYYDKIVQFVSNRGDADNAMYLEHKLSSGEVCCDVEWFHQRRESKKKSTQQYPSGAAVQKKPKQPKQQKQADGGAKAKIDGKVNVRRRKVKRRQERVDKGASGENSRQPESAAVSDKNQQPEGVVALDKNQQPEGVVALDKNQQPEGAVALDKNQQPEGAVVSDKSRQPEGAAVSDRQEQARKEELVRKFAEARKRQEELDRQEEERREAEKRAREERAKQEELQAREQFQLVKKRIQEREQAEEQEREQRIQALMDEMNALVGLRQVKEEIQSLINLIKIRQLRQKMSMPMMEMSYHMVFTGSPGTGKTTVARLVGRLYKELGILSDGKMIETDRSGLVAGYVGQTAIKVHEIVEEAIGGVLFIDEAYSLVNPDVPNDFGGEAVDTLVKLMEDHRDNLVIIVAGYTEEMQNFLKSNTGLISRFNKFIDFPDYSREELIAIMQSMASGAGLLVTEEAKARTCEFLDKMDKAQWRDFGNARGIRNLFEKIVMHQANRLVQMEHPSKEDLMTILPADVEML